MTGKTDPGALAQAYVYDRASQRINLTDPDGGVRTYTYDNDGRTTVFQEPDRQPDHEPIRRGRPDDDDPVRRGHEAAVRLRRRGPNDDRSSSRPPRESQLTSSVYSYDGVGNRVGIQWNTGMLTTYEYDAKDRLIQDATSGLNTHTYNYSLRWRRQPADLQRDREPGDFHLRRSPAAGDERREHGRNHDLHVRRERQLTNVANPDGSLITMSYDKENRLAVHQVGLLGRDYTFTTATA